MSRTTYAVGTVLQTTGISIGAALALIILGAIAVLMPLAVGIAVSIFVVWLIAFAGLAHLVHAWDARGDAIFLWRLLVGLLYLAGGIYLVLNPGYGLGAITLFIGGMFVVEAALLLGAAFWLRHAEASRWLVLDAVCSLLLAVILFSLWPWTASWLLGVLVGINIMSSGMVFLLLMQENDLQLRETRA